MLRAIGGECAGVISILPVEREPSEDRSYRLLADEELARLVAQRGQIYAAGAQDKCPVLIRDGSTFLPEGEAPSSHILKFELADYRHLPAYETFANYLARQIGLPVVDTQNLLRWQIFNVLAGNSDGHAKNLSLLYLPNGGIRLPPFYDLICTRAIERVVTQQCNRAARI